MQSVRPSNHLPVLDMVPTLLLQQRYLSPSTFPRVILARTSSR
uniref:Uncharacterized protein n=1 Tax=Anguilla anguilla TaxID=7936 RepID=A0A0E9S6C1_ANGAN